MSGSDVGRQRSSPYPGPRPFTEADREVFFGRAAEANDVRSLWLGGRVLVLHGPAAVGKTSLLQAGVLPLVKGQGVDVLRIGRVVHQSARPLAVASDRDAYRHSLITSWAPDELPPPPGTSLGTFLADRPVQRNAYGEPGSLLAAIDHFEELFSSFPARTAEREELIDELAEALHVVDRLRLLIVIRDDHLGDLADHEYRLSPSSMARIRLTPLRPEPAQQAVIGPARVAGGHVAVAVAERLVDDLRAVRYLDAVGGAVEFLQDFVEPLSLQIACEQLWVSQSAGTGGPGAVGRRLDVDHALAAFYDEAVRRVAAEHRVPEASLRQWVESTFISELRTRATAYRGLAMTAGVPNEVADALVAEQVLTTAQRSLATWYELSQGRLIPAISRSNRAWRAAHDDGTDGGDADGGEGVDKAAAGPPPIGEKTPGVLRAAAEDAWGRGNYAAAYRLVELAADRYRRLGDEWAYADTTALHGAIARTEGDLPRTVDCYRRALSGFDVIADLPSMIRLYSDVTDLLVRMGHYGAAAELSLEALQRAPRDVAALVSLGYALWYQGSRADALSTLASALAAGREPRALTARGQILADLGQEDEEALIELDEALQFGLAPAEEADTRSARAVVLTRMGRHAEADADLAAARSLDAMRGLTGLRTARISRLRGDDSAARSHLQSALTARPPLPPVHSSDARALLDQLATGTDDAGR